MAIIVKLFFSIFSISILVFPIPVISQENSESGIHENFVKDPLSKSESNQIFDEDPLSETDTDLGLVEDPQISNESDQSFKNTNIENIGLDSVSDEDILDDNQSEELSQEENIEEIDKSSDLEVDPFDENESEGVTQENNLEESDENLGLESDPFDENESEGVTQENNLEESDENLGLETDPFDENESEGVTQENNLEESDENLGLETDPFEETDTSLDLGEDTFSEDSNYESENIKKYQKNGNQNDIEQILEEEEFTPKVFFSHEVKTMLGGSETKGLSLLDPLLSEIKEIRLVTTYDQSVKVQTSPQMYNYFRLSISFSQNYELQKKRIFDGFATLREIYSNYRVGSHQIRYGTQIFDLGKVDLDKVIDVLHMNNIMGIYTFDPDDSKDAIPSIRYNWFRGGHTATFFISPIRQQTFGMRFTEFREDVEKKEQGNEGGKVSFLRDYYGLQYQWTGEIMDTRLGMFHWFDSNPYIKLEYQKVGDNGTTLQGSFENMLSNYNEKETRSDFLTLEIDATWTDMVWKFESGFFKKRNLYSYEVPEGEVVRLSTLSAPHFAFSTSLERTFPYFYWLMLFSHRKWYDVPSNSHVFLYENESDLVSKKRDLFRNQVSGVAVLKTPDNSLRITLLNYQTWPFKQKGFASLFTWERFKEDMELELKFFRLETEKQKMLQDKIKTNQIFLTYTQKFKAN